MADDTSFPKAWDQHQRDIVYSLRRRIKEQQRHIKELQKVIADRNAEIAALTATPPRSEDRAAPAPKS